MKCQNEDGCDGELDLDNHVGVKIGCTSFRNAYPCLKCGRLHFLDGSPLTPSAICNRAGHRSFLLDDGLESAVINKDENGVEQSRY